MNTFGRGKVNRDAHDLGEIDDLLGPEEKIVRLDDLDLGHRGR